VAIDSVAASKAHAHGEHHKFRYRRSDRVRINAARLSTLLLVLFFACAFAPQASGPVYDAMPDAIPDAALPDDPQATDPLTCSDRATIPTIDNAFEATWAPDSKTLAISKIVTIPNRRTITGYEEDQRLTLLNIATGQVREIGQGSEPAFSGSGAYLSYWTAGYQQLRVLLGTKIVAYIDSTLPETRWVGDELYFFHDDEIRVWTNGLQWTVAHVPHDLIPSYPRDDVYFSADGQQFTMNRYFQNGTTERYLGTTRTGAMTALDGNVSFSEWSPVGHTLLERTADGVALVLENGTRENARVADLAGRVHGWTADGRLYFGKMSPTVPGGNAFDRFTLWGTDTITTLPNLLGIRAFSPDGKFFAGTTRTGLYPTQLEVYQCGVTATPTEATRADTAARSRQQRIESDGRRFVRPVSGAITQFLQGSHTGIDIAAPYGSIIVAADDGVVDAVGWVPVGGRRVCVEQGGIESCDYHTSLPLVSIGDHVVRGQPVALIGLTGATSGPHVHWEVKRDGRVVDPLKQ
jgi:murein DD-endopeptidase MepM/ murein hydrolase activator NlpD